MSLASLHNFSTVLSELLPEASLYKKGRAVDGNVQYLSAYGSFAGKDDVANFARKVFDLKANDLISILSQEADLFGIKREFCVSGSGVYGTLDQRGSFGLITGQKDLIFSAGSSLTIELADKTLKCGTAGDVVVCGATVGGRSVLDEGHWVSWIPYVLGAGAAYYGGKTVWESGKTLLEIGRVCHKVVVPQIMEGLVQCSTPVEGSSAPQKRPTLVLFPILKDLWNKRNELKTSQGEPIGKACRRIGVNLTKSVILAYAACATYRYDSKYFRI